jgi:acyl-CoA thioester hydrolase
MADAAHHFRCRVYWEDTDGAGIVYYANYLKFAERARTEMLRDAGLEQRRLFDERGVAFAVKRCACEYHRPARLDDALDVVTTVTELRGASLDLRQLVRRDGELLAGLDVTIACLRRDGRPARLPPPLRHALATILPSSSASDF